MSASPITIKKVGVRPHPAFSEPEFGAPSVLCADPWDFVGLWLRKNKEKQAGIFWAQAAAFYEATQDLTRTSAPLTAYYCLLNATKALLLAKRQTFSDRHGISGYHVPHSKAALKNEVVILQRGGVLPAFCNLVGQPVTAKETHTLEGLLYSIPFVHRAFRVTYPSGKELFLPLNRARFVRKDRSKESWVEAEIPERYNSRTLAASLPTGWEVDAGVTDRVVVRRKARFDWNGRQLVDSKVRLANYHRKSREVLLPIFSRESRWYLRKEVNDARRVNRDPMILTLAAMHRLSELSRYVPDRLERHFEGRQNWLLAEFLRVAPAQYVYAVASEMTGREILKPDSYGLTNTRIN